MQANSPNKQPSISQAELWLLSNRLSGPGRSRKLRIKLHQIIKQQVESEIESALANISHRAVEKEKKFLESLNKKQISLSGLGLSTYPKLLFESPEPPICFFYQADPDFTFEPQNNLSIAIVGSRNASAQARIFTEKLAYELCSLGVRIISGLAYGVDICAHRGALFAIQDAGVKLQSNPGAGIAVLGSGLQSIYPSAHKQIAQGLVKFGGALVSEYPPKENPRKLSFLERNRIIAGLSHGVIVVEAAKRSGSLSTARYALESGREVAAVPGPVGSPNHVGTNALLKQGAHLIETAEDVLSIFPQFKPQAPSSQNPNKSDPQSQSDKLSDRIITYLRLRREATIETLQVDLNADLQTLSSTLTCLELAGSIYRHPGERFSIHEFPS